MRTVGSPMHQGHALRGRGSPVPADRLRPLPKDPAIVERFPATEMIAFPALADLPDCHASGSAMFGLLAWRWNLPGPQLPHPLDPRNALPYHSPDAPRR